MKKILVLICLVSVIVIAGCKNKEFVDITAELKLEADTSNTSFTENGVGEVILNRCIDGDTVHFKDAKTNTEIKARFLGVDTPESTGKIEIWGKKASKFTCDRVTQAKKIVLSSVGSIPEKDSSGRDLAYVWADGRLINLELVQEGFSPYKQVVSSNFNDIFLRADFQAQKFKKYIWSNEIDPEFYYGEAIFMTIKELREKATDYMGTKVTVEGIVTRKLDKNAFIQESINGEEFGIFLFSQYRDFKPMKKVGNKVKVTGVLTEFNGSIQLTDLKYSEAYPSSDDMILISENNTVIATEISIDNLNLSVNKFLAQTLIKLKNVICTGGKTEDTGAYTVYGTVDGKRINLRFDKDCLQNFSDAAGNLITSHTYFEGKTLDVVGIVDIYFENYQIKIITSKDLIIK